jgi:hypothetical protein
MKNKQIKIFLDDFRYPDTCLMYMYPKIGAEAKIYTDEKWVIVKNYDEFKKSLLKHAGNISHVSFDHDLADEHYTTPMLEWIKGNYEPKEKTGFDCACLLLNLYHDENLPLPKIYVHSMNPVGAEKIKNLF